MILSALRHRIITYAILLLLCCVAVGCTSIPIKKIETGSIVAISASSTGLGAAGSGVSITLRNSNTGQELESTSLGKLSNHSIVQNVPAGDYTVVRIEIPVGNITYTNRSANVPSYFGTITVAADHKYYLGNFSGKRSIGLKNILTFTLKDTEVPLKLREAVETSKTGWADRSFIKILPASTAELIIY